MNLANKLTLFRIILIPAFLVAFEIGTRTSYFIALIIFILASLTDKLDGYIARSRNQITKLGKFMDPLADKLLVSSALVALVEEGFLPTWVVMIIITREFAVTGLRAIAASEGIVIAASNWGKLKTVFQMVTVILTISVLVIDIPYLYEITYVLIIITTIVTLISGVDYFVKNKKVLVK